MAKSFVDLLNPDQKLIFDDVLDSIHSALYDRFKHFFVDGPGGTGKTFLFKALIHYLRSLGFIVVPVAWTGMAASLVDGGKTVHSTFSLSVPLVSEIAPKIKKDSEKGKLLINAKLIIWDE